MSSSSDVVQWFKEIPPITRHWFGLSIALPILGRIVIISPYWCVLTPDYISTFQLWRPITALFYYPINGRTGIHYLMNIYFLYNYSKQPGAPTTVLLRGLGNTITKISEAEQHYEPTR